MTRKEELLKIFDQIEDTKGIILPMIDDVVFLNEDGLLEQVYDKEDK